MCGPCSAGQRADLIALLEREQSLLRRGIAGETVITVEVIGADVGQHGDIARQAVRKVDLIAREFEHIDAVFGERIARKDRQADVAAHQRRDARAFQHVGYERSHRRFAVGAGDADDAVRRQIGRGLGKKFDVAKDRHAGFARMIGDRMAVERHAGRHDDAGKADKVDLQRIADVGAERHRSIARRLAFVPRGHACPAGDQRRAGRQPRARQSQHRIAATGEGARGDHRSLSVASPASARTIETIQKRTTTVDSGQPNCSK